MSTYLRIILLFTLSLSSLLGQTVSQNFNKSVNQIGECWQWENMKITTKNTINSKNQKKALTGTNPTGDPAYHFTSPIIRYSSSGNIVFKHKLDANNGNHRELQVRLLDINENLISVLHSHVYIDSLSGSTPNGNPTNVVQTTIPITFSGTYILRFHIIGDGGTSLFMVDDIEIDGSDQSDFTNDNGYGYCRANDTIYDTICAYESEIYHTPLQIVASTWEWSFNGTQGGQIDTTLIAGNADSIAEVTWGANGGDFELWATEVRPPYNTRTYIVHYMVHVLPPPILSWTIDSVCEDELHTATLNFSGGTEPWLVTFEDEDSTFTQSFTDPNSVMSLGVYENNQTLSIQSVEDANGCLGDTTGLSVVTWIRGKPILGPIWHY